jgi:superfamily II RNA helicase
MNILAENIRAQCHARVELSHYAEAVAMWSRGFDTVSISIRTQVPEAIIERWVWNFREVLGQPKHEVFA